MILNYLKISGTEFIKSLKDQKESNYARNEKYKESFSYRPSGNACAERFQLKGR